jgi:glycolate oxidase
VPAAGNAVSAILRSGTVPAALELMDRLCVEAVEKFAGAGLPLGAGAVLLIELEGAAAEVDGDEAVVRSALAAAAPLEVRVAADADARARLWKARKQAAGALGRICRGYYTHDGCVPPSRLAEALARIGAIATGHRIRVATLAHAGDGNIHPLFLFDSVDPDEMARGAAAGRAALDLCLELGGSLTGEHGVGGEKRDLLGLQYTEPTIDLFRRLHLAFDPTGRMNPEKMFPRARQYGDAPRDERAPMGGTKPIGGWL